MMGTDARADTPVPDHHGDPGGGGPATSASGRLHVTVLCGVAAFVLTADVVSKIIVVAHLAGRPPIRLLGGFLTLRLLRNSGAAFSIGTSMTVVFTAIAVGVIIFILRTARRLRSLPWAITLGLLLGGATGNLADRIFRSPGPMRGFVVDWIQLPHWPVFNLADSAIVCGGVLAVLLAVRGLRVDGTLDTGRRPLEPHRPAGSPDQADQAGHVGQVDQAGKVGQMGQADQAGQAGQAGKVGQMGQAGQAGQMGQASQADQAVQPSAAD
jgi:signal peptidase II